MKIVPPLTRKSEPFESSSQLCLLRKAVLQCSPSQCRVVTAKGELEILACFFINCCNLDSVRPVQTQVLATTGRNRKQTAYPHLISSVP